VEAWKSLARYDKSCRFSTWLYSILLHRHQKWLRRARSRPLPLAWLPFFQRDDLLARHANIPAPEASPAESAAQTENAALMLQCLARLSEKHRQVIRLRFFEDASLADMARVLDCPVGTVKSRLHHALEALRKIKMNLSELKGDTQL
jgi:RNA polymerase sigma-70 factor (ECF subfamily)